MAKEKEVRSERVGTSFTPTEMKKIDEYCQKLNMSRSEFVSAAVCVTLENDIAVSIPSYSGVVCNVAVLYPLQGDHIMFQSLLIQGWFVTRGKQ